MSARFCPECGTALREQAVDGTARAVCPQCGYIHFRDPKLVAVTLITKGDHVLLVQRDIEPARGLWSLPGGYVNWDEHPEAAAVRECAEEIRARVELRGLLGIVQVITPAKVGIVIMAYRGDIVDGEPQVGHEVQQVAYFPLHQLPPLAFESHRRLLGDLALQNAS